MVQKLNKYFTREYREAGDFTYFISSLHLSFGGADRADRGANGGAKNAEGGRIFLFGDSSCADDASLQALRGESSDCLWMFVSAVRYACEVRIKILAFWLLTEIWIWGGGLEIFASSLRLDVRER